MTEVNKIIDIYAVMLIILCEKIAKQLKIIIINSCDSHEIAKQISKSGCTAIGMLDTISDKAAIDFSVGFYQAIGNNENIITSFNNGLVTMSSNPTNMIIPSLWQKGQKIS